IRPGSTLRGATRQIIEAGLSMPEWKFVLLARANGASAEVKAGSYQVSAGVTPLLLVRKITRGEYAQAEILFVEGWNFRQMREALNAHVDLKHDSASLSEAQIMAKLGAPGVLPEGMFFPDTYVFANRLRLRMKLQTDPSVIYGMGERFDGNLRKRDLVTDTPFNTYTRQGLPPHPIAMPGLPSLAAVMHPAETDALYFVSRGDGTSEFSRTLVEPNRA